MCAPYRTALLLQLHNGDIKKWHLSQTGNDINDYTPGGVVPSVFCTSNNRLECNKTTQVRENESEFLQNDVNHKDFI